MDFNNHGSFYKNYQLSILHDFFGNMYSEFLLYDKIGLKDDDKIIIYPSPIEWETQLFQRPHHLLREFAKRGYKVFFITPDYKRDNVYPFRKINNNLYLIKDAGLLYPLRNKEVFIWISWTPNIIFKKIFNKAKLIYDWIDRLKIFNYYCPLMEIDHIKLLMSADYVFTSSSKLLEDANRFRKDAAAIPNGVYIEDFSISNPPIPDDIRSIVETKRPIIGFYGFIADWRLDYDLINEVTLRCKDLNFLFIGPSDETSVKKIEKRENLFLLGPKRYSVLKNYLHYFDTAIIPYKLDEITEAIFPVKLCEYMAGGTPVVSTPLRDVKTFKSVLIADDANEFSKLLHKAVKLKKDADYQQLLRQEAFENTWQKRIDTVEKVWHSLSKKNDNKTIHSKIFDEELNRFEEIIFKLLQDKYELSEKESRWVADYNTLLEENRKKQDKISYEENLLNNALQEKTEIQQQLSQTIEDKSLIVEKFNDLLTDKNDLSTQLQKSFNDYTALDLEKGKIHAKLEGTLREKTEIQQQMSQIIEEKNRLFQLLDEIYSSDFWKVANWYYKIKELLLSPKGKKEQPELAANTNEKNLPIIYEEKENKVSIVLPVYNQSDLIKESIESVLNQTYSNIELIIVNDGSTDGIEEILDEYINDPKVKILTQKNQKLPTALNNGFEYAAGKYLTWTSADNVMMPNMIKTLVKFLQKNPDVGMVYADYQAIDDKGNPLNDKNFRSHNQDKSDHSIIRLPKNVTFENLHDSGDNFIGACFLYRDYVAKIVGKYDTDAFGAEDYDYWMRIDELFKIAHADSSEILYKYRVHDNTLNARAKELGIFDNVRNLLKLDTERRQVYKQDFNITCDGIDISNIYSNPGSYKKVMVFTKRSGYIPENLKNTVYILFIDKIDETEFSNEILSKSDFIIAINIECFSILYNNWKSKLLLLDISDKNILADIIRKISNSVFFRKKKAKLNVTGHYRIYLKEKLNLVIETRTLDKGGLEKVIHDLSIELNNNKVLNIWIAVMEKSGYISELIKKSGVKVVPFHKNIDSYKSFLKENNIRIVNSHYSPYIYKTGFKGKIIETIHNYYVWFSEKERIEFGNSLKRSDSIICVSHGVVSYSRKIFNFDPRKEHIIPNGINDINSIIDTKMSRKEIRKNLGVKSEEILILNVAAYTPVKAQNVLISAAIKIKNFLLKNNIKIMCVGHILDENYKDYLDSLIRKYALDDVLKLEDFHPREDILKLLYTADIFVLPSFIEGWSIALMEAMGFGLPVIASNVGSAPEIVRPVAGIIISQPSDVLSLTTEKIITLSKEMDLPIVDELAKAIVDMVSEIDYWKSKKGAREGIIKQYSIPKMANSYIDVFEKSMLN